MARLYGIYDLDIVAGSTWRTSIKLKDKDDVYYDLTGCTCQLTAKIKMTDTLPLIDLNEANGGALLNADFNGFDFYISDTNTALLPDKNIPYNIEVTFPNGDVNCVLLGYLRIDRQVIDG